jgi:RNase P/RNase MRP subunit p29
VNVIGELLKVRSATDPTLTGRTGMVILETANTLVLESQGRNLRVPKIGTAFVLLGSGKVVEGKDMAGRLQDRLARSSR